jgi:signal peptide peptidase SppA
MSDFAARSAISRMNMREVALAVHYTGLSQDLRDMAAAIPEVEQEKLLARRNEMCETFGLAPQPKQAKPFAFSNGIAVIPVQGTLVNRFGQSYGFVTGYNFIARQLAQAMADDEVKGIIYDVNSYGGEAAGCFELAAAIREASKTKPSMSVVDSNAYSAGYALASAASKMYVTPSGGVGSIGVVAMHMSFEKMLDKEGVKVTFIQFGAHKTDGNPYEDLSAEAKANIQASVNKSGEAFVALVAENRSIDKAKVKATEAKTYRADEALSLGLIDAIATPQAAAQVLFDELSGSISETVKKDDAMSEKTEAQPGANDRATNTAANAQAANPVVTPTAGPSAEDARVAERARVKGILNCEEAKGKSALANHLAMETDMSAESAKAILKASASEAPAAAAPNAFQAAMEASANPNVGAGLAAPAAGAQGSADLAASILRDQAALTGEKFAVPAK